MEQAAKTWTGKWWEFGGGGTVWDSITYDPATNLVFFGTGNAEPWNPRTADRAGDSLYTSSIVAVNADTGEYGWHYQETPEDRWDYDSNAQIMVADRTLDGKPTQVVMPAPKNGDVADRGAVGGICRGRDARRLHPAAGRCGLHERARSSEHAADGLSGPRHQSHGSRVRQLRRVSASVAATSPGSRATSRIRTRMVSSCDGCTPADLTRTGLGDRPFGPGARLAA